MPMNAMHCIIMRCAAITLAILPHFARAGEAPKKTLAEAPNKPLTEALALVDIKALGRAVADLAQNYPEIYGAQKEALLAQLADYDKALADIRKGVAAKKR